MAVTTVRPLLFAILSWRDGEVGGINVVLAGYADEREQGIAAGVGQRGAIRCGVVVPLIAQTGQSEEIHSPDECASMVVKLMVPAVWSIAVVCTVAISCWPKVLHDVESARKRGIAE
jgi:hypothetical protein